MVNFWTTSDNKLNLLMENIDMTLQIYQIDNNNIQLIRCI
jgi:hypothetical protein